MSEVKDESGAGKDPGQNDEQEFELVNADGETVKPKQDVTEHLQEDLDNLIKIKQEYEQICAGSDQEISEEVKSHNNQVLDKEINKLQNVFKDMERLKKGEIHQVDLVEPLMSPVFRPDFAQLKNNPGKKLEIETASKHTFKGNKKTGDDFKSKLGAKKPSFSIIGKILSILSLFGLKSIHDKLSMVKKQPKLTQDATNKDTGPKRKKLN